MTINLGNSKLNDFFPCLSAFMHILHTATKQLFFLSGVMILHVENITFVNLRGVLHTES